jgi:hypothetical protein
MAVNKNLTVKLDLDEAMTIRRALERHRDALVAEANEHGDGTTAGDELAQAARAEAGRAETMLRRDF